MANMSLELLTSRRRIEGVVIAEQRRLVALGIASYADVHIVGAQGGSAAECARALKPTFVTRLLHFLRDR